MNKKQILIVFLLLLLFGSFGSSHAATVFTETFNSATSSGSIYQQDMFSEKWSSTNYYTSATPAATGWTFGGSAFLAQNGNNTADKAILLNEAPVGHGSMSTSFNVTPNTNYVLTFEYWGDNIPSTILPLNINYYLFNVTIGSQSQDLGGLWFKPSGLSNTTSINFNSGSNTSIVLSFLDESNGAASSIIDNIKVSSVPIPGAIWIFGTGLLGLIGIRKRIQN
jgi:hypothetical protein